MSLRLGLIGLGKQGQRYLEPKNGGEGIVARCGRRLFSIDDRHVGGSDDPVGEVMRNVDAVIIATPAETHAELAIRCLEAGKPALVEKPLATTWADCQRVLETSRRTGVPLMVGHTHLFAEPWLRVVNKCPRAFIAYIGGPCELSPLLDWMPHLVAMALHVRPQAWPIRDRNQIDCVNECGRWTTGLYLGSGFAQLSATKGGSRLRAVMLSPVTGNPMYDPDAPCEHTALWHQVECFKRICKGETDPRASLEFTEQVYRVVFGELQ